MGLHRLVAGKLADWLQPGLWLQMSLRAVTLLSKFVLTFFLAKTLAVQHFVEYGLFAAWVMYALYFVGFDYYAFATRFIVRYRKKAGTVLATQLTFYALLYALVALLVCGLWLNGQVPGKLALFFVLILIAEHLSQEGFRLFVATDHLSLANLAQFLRTGLWCLLGIAICLWFNTISLELVLSLWLGSAALSVLFLGYYGRQRFGNVFKAGVSPFFLRAGLVKASTLFVATMLLRGIFTFDRVLMERWAAPDAVAAYLFFWTVANGYLAFVDVGIVARIYPKMLAAKSAPLQRELAQAMRFKVALAYLLLALLLLASLPWMDRLLPGLAYREFFFVLPLVILASLLHSLGLGDHYLLYAQKRDGLILRAAAYAAFGFLLGIGLFWLNGWLGQAWAVPVIVSLSCAILTLTRQLLIRRKLCNLIS